MTRLILFLVLTPTFLFAQDKYFDSNGVRIRYIDQGSGEPLILVHGFSGDIERNWINTGVLPALAKNFRVIALDLRGHGKSGKPHDPKAYGIEVVRDVLRLMDDLKIARAHIVGYSFGGQLAAKLLNINAERFITATLGGVAPPRGAASPAGLERAAAEFEGPTPFRSTVLQILPTDEPPPPEQTIRKNAELFAAPNDLAAMAALFRGWWDLSLTEAQLNAIRVPTLAVVGTADPMLANVNTMKKEWPALKVVTIDGATHSNIMPPGRGAAARPEFVNAIREFIASKRQ